MPRFAANLSMLFTEQDFMDRFAAAAQAGFSGVEYLFPYDFPCRADQGSAGCQQADPCCSTCRPVTGPAASVASPSCRSGSRSSAPAWTRPSPTPRCWATPGQLPGRHRPRGADLGQLEITFIENLRYAAQKLEEAGIRPVMEMINTRDIPRFFLNNTSQRRRFAARSVTPTCSCSTTSTTCRSWRRPGAHHREQPSRRSIISSWRTTPTQRARHRRDQLSLPVRASGSHRLPWLGRLRIQAGHHHRSRPWLAEKPQRHLINSAPPR